MKALGFGDVQRHAQGQTVVRPKSKCAWMDRCLSISGSASTRNAGEYPLSHGHKSISLWKTAQGSSGVLPGMRMMVEHPPPLVLPSHAVGCGSGGNLGLVEGGRAKRGVNGANDSTDMSYIITVLILQA